MARARRKRAVRSGAVTASLRNLIESIATRVADRMSKTIAGRDEIRSLERQVKDLARRVDARGARTGARRPGRPPSNKVCKVRGCGLKHVAQGYCSKHYQAWRRKAMAAQAATGKRAKA